MLPKTTLILISGDMLTKLMDFCYPKQINFNFLLLRFVVSALFSEYVKLTIQGSGLSEPILSFLTQRH